MEMNVVDDQVYSGEGNMARIEAIKQILKNRFRMFHILHSTLEFECEDSRNCTVVAPSRQNPEEPADEAGNQIVNRSGVPGRLASKPFTILNQYTTEREYLSGQQRRTQDFITKFGKRACSRTQSLILS